MALPSKLYRFKIELSDPEKDSYESLDFRVAQHNMGGSPKVWIEIGNPSARKVHKASKASEKVKIYTYKDPQVLLNELNSEPVHRREKLEIYSISQGFLDQLEKHTKKDNRWTLINMDGAIMINGEGFDLQSEVKRH